MRGHCLFVGLYTSVFGYLNNTFLEPRKSAILAIKQIGIGTTYGSRQLMNGMVKFKRNGWMDGWLRYGSSSK